MISGVVVHGKQLGRQLGFPTANLCVDELQGQLPEAGVYAAWATLPDGQRRCAMVNVGYRPTVDGPNQRLSVEAHLADFHGDLYGQHLTLDIVSRIREERQMTSLEQLRRQLQADLQLTLQTCGVII